MIRTILRLYGRDKLVGRGTTIISNDGINILKLLEILYPAAKRLVNINQAQDAIVSDSTTLIMLLTAKILKMCKALIKDNNLHQQILIQYFCKACKFALEYLPTLSITL